MIAANESFSGSYPFEPHFSRAPGFAMHYADEGRGAPILLLHGEPSWSYLYRHIIPRLATKHRVVAPDMKGFGKSETPKDGRYEPEDQIKALEALVLDLDLRDATLVVHDWGGPIGTGVMLAHPERFRRIVVINAPLPLGLPQEAELLAQAMARSRYFRWMAALYQRGTLETVLGELGVIVSSIMRDLQGVSSLEAGTAEWVRAYSAPFASPDECVGAIALPRSIVSGAAARSVPGASRVAEVRAKPAMMMYGMQDRVLLPEQFIRLFELQFVGAPVLRLPRAGHFAPEDEPEAISALIDEFVGLRR